MFWCYLKVRRQHVLGNPLDKIGEELDKVLVSIRAFELEVKIIPAVGSNKHILGKDSKHAFQFWYVYVQCIKVFLAQAVHGGWFNGLDVYA